MGWRKFSDINHQDLGPELENVYVELADTLSSQHLSCEYAWKTSRSFSRVVAGKMNALYFPAHHRLLRGPHLCWIEMAMFIRNDSGELVSCQTVEFRYSIPEKGFAVPCLSPETTLSKRFQRRLGVVANVHCTRKDLRSAEFLQLELELLEMCVHDVLLHADDSFTLIQMIDSVIGDPLSRKEIVLVVMCPWANDARKKDLEKLGLKPSVSNWGQNRAYQAVFEHVMPMPGP